MILRRMIPIVIVFDILITTFGCTATTESTGRGRYSRHGSHDSQTTTVEMTDAGVAVVGGVLGLLLIRDLVWGPPQQVVVAPGQQYVPSVSPECEQYLGNERALAACERGVVRRRVDEQQRLERDAYNAGYGR